MSADTVVAAYLEGVSEELAAPLVLAIAELKDA